MSLRHAPIVIIGAGFSGIGLGRRLLLEHRRDFVILERSDGVGGVWRSNTYPGARCDVPSHLYSFSFAPNPEWSATYSAQPEIRAYLERCVADFGVEPYLHYGVEVTGATWNAEDQLWHIEASDGPWTARVLVSAVGPLTEPKLPDVPGIGSFEGEVMHSARWDHDYDLTGARVASIGTGASAIQYVPAIADRVGELFVFQRTPPWVVPHGARAITDAERAKFRAGARRQRRQRRRIYFARESLLVGFAKRPGLLRLVEAMSRRHIATQIPDPTLRRLVTPHYVLGCKRLVPSNDWYPALQKPNVTLVPAALREIRPHSVIDSEGVEREVDAIIFGTGFHVADVPIGDVVRGRGGRLLSDVWAGSPRAYLGTAMPGFPNLFLFLGPNTGLGHSSMILMIEAQIEHIAHAIHELDAAGAGTIEVRPEAHDAYNRELDRKLATTVWETGGCSSWYHDVNGRNATIYPDWTWRFRRQATGWKADAYTLGPAASAVRHETADAR